MEAIGIVNGTKKLDEAKEFVDWFGSAEVQGEWAEEFSTLPANEKAVDKANEFNQEIAKISGTGYRLGSCGRKYRCMV